MPFAPASSKLIAMKPIFSYIDYRRFLHDFYEEKKRNTRHFSYRYFAARAGVTSPVFFKLVFEGKRNLSTSMVSRFAAALGLNPKESTFFAHLVRFNQARTALEKQEHYSVLVAMMGNVAERQLEKDHYEYFSHWYTPVVRELICSNGFRGDVAALAASVRPGIRPKEAKAAIDLLLRLRLVERKADGTYSQTAAALHGGGEIASLGLRAFNRQMVERALESIDSVPVEQRHVSGITAGISRQT